MDKSGVIRTERLILRPLRAEDAKPIAEGIGHWDIIKWLTTPPWPYGLADAEWFVKAPAGAEARAIDVNGELAGIIGLHGGKRGADLDLGYWLNIRHHGKGYMTEAARALVADYFAKGGTRLVSGYLVGNAASCNVLTKLGFLPTEVITEISVPIGHLVRCQRMVLTHADWSL